MPLFVLVALAGAVISVSRILVTNSAALSELVWAEDGLFPLCINSYGYFSCLIDPFAGYLLFLSRTLALPVSFFPLSNWPLVTNLVAAIAIGVGFAPVETAFLSANLLKFADGGWVPVLLAIALFALMRIWQTGSAAVQTQADEMQIPVGDLVAQIFLLVCCSEGLQLCDPGSLLFLDLVPQGDDSGDLWDRPDDLHDDRICSEIRSAVN